MIIIIIAIVHYPYPPLFQSSPAIAASLVTTAAAAVLTPILTAAPITTGSAALPAACPSHNNYISMLSRYTSLLKLLI